MFIYLYYNVYYNVYTRMFNINFFNGKLSNKLFDIEKDLLADESIISFIFLYKNELI